MQNTEASLCCPQFCPSPDILYKQSQTLVSLPEQVSSNKPIGHSLLRNRLVVAIAPKKRQRLQRGMWKIIYTIW